MFLQRTLESSAAGGEKKGNIPLKDTPIGLAMLGTKKNHFSPNICYSICLFLFTSGGATRCRSVYVEDAAAIDAFTDWFRHCSDKPKNARNPADSNSASATAAADASGTDRGRGGLAGNRGSVGNSRSRGDDNERYTRGGGQFAALRYV